MKYVRQLSADNKYLQGVVLFSYDGVKDTPHYLTQIKHNVFAGPAGLPVQTAGQYAQRQPAQYANIAR